MGDISYYHYLYAIKAGMPTELDMQEIIFDFTGCKYIMKLYDIITIIYLKLSIISE